MGEGIKLYKKFFEQINKMGRPKRAWFTTFNLDVDFFEKYILSALMSSPYTDLKSPYDYEALSAQLANEQESLAEDRMEVRVFYDYRALIQANKPKQTSVHLHPIDIKQLTGLNPDLKFSEGVFHPKVVLIETISGEYWLMVSSANLTFGGWAKNRECFFCEKIESTKIARNVGLFFEGITSQIKGFKENQLLAKLSGGLFGKKDTKWYFFSSFNHNRFLDQLNNTRFPCPLKVWSPYFAGDLDIMLKETIGNEYFIDIILVPAKNERQKIRITEQTYLACQKVKEISFKQEKLPAAANESFVHAKVWLTPSSLAIGSWNMTRSGMNIALNKNNNVEAGIIYELTPKAYENILDQYPSTALKSPEHFSEEEMAEEKEEILDDFSIAVDLVANWDNLVIKLSAPGFTKLISHLPGDSFIQLPGIGKRDIKILENDISFRNYSQVLLTDRYFEIANNKGKIYFKGYIREIGLISRPVNSFQNIDDYMKGWVSGMPESKEELIKPSYGNKVEEEFGDELSAQTRKILMSDDQNAWFSSFHAFESIIKRINETDQFYKYSKIEELKRIGRVLPGSLSELKKHLLLLRESYEKDRGNFLKSPIYLWFLIEKANVVFRYFNRKIEISEEYIKPLHNFSIEEVFSENQLAEYGKEQLQSWAEYITSKLQNVG